MNLLKPVILSIMAAGIVFACKPPAETDNETAGKDTGVKLIAVKTDPESIDRGANLFYSMCRFCHVTSSTETKAGPGLKGILRKSRFPVSKKPATPGNIINQLNSPYRQMPSFSYLSEDDMLNIIAYLNTL